MISRRGSHIEPPMGMTWHYVASSRKNVTIFENKIISDVCNTQPICYNKFSLKIAH
jgi:hypothetical protein